MIEKVNMFHPDKVADRIAGALVDIAYTKEENPRVAIEVLIGHGQCVIIGESSVEFQREEVVQVVSRITGGITCVSINLVKQDVHLSDNQKGAIRCGDNGIFKGCPLTAEQKQLSTIARAITEKFPSDGKYILDFDRLIICQSNAKGEELKEVFNEDFVTTVNPLGDWDGGTNVDTGATNRKLGSDMADSVTGGGLHGKDLSKADVSVNIYAFLLAQKLNEPVKMCCAIGDEAVNGVPYENIVEIARDYIKAQGGFEKFAEWGLF